MKDRIVSKAKFKKETKLTDGLPNCDVEKIFKAAIIGTEIDTFVLERTEYESGHVSMTVELKTKTQ